MMRKNLKAAALILTLMLLCGCVPKNTEIRLGTTSRTKAATSASSTEVYNETAFRDGKSIKMSVPGDTPIVTHGELTLSIGICQTGLVDDYYDNSYTRLLEHESGIDIEFKYLPSDGNEAAKLVMQWAAAGERLPDILIGVSLSDAQQIKLSQLGVLSDISGYLKNRGFFFSQQCEKWLTADEYDELISRSAASDGKIYSFPFLTQDLSEYGSRGIWINKDWLSAVGAKMPATADELLTVLKKFLTKDPNKNKKRDEIPLLGSTEAENDVTAVIINAYTPFPSPCAVGGKVYVPYLTSEYRLALVYLRRLRTANLLSPLSFNANADMLSAIVDMDEGGAAIVGAFAGNPDDLFSQGSVRRESYVPLPPVSGPKNVAYAQVQTKEYEFGAFVTSDVPQAAFRLLDLMCREDISLSSRFGIQGENWSYSDEGEPLYLSVTENAVYSSDGLVWGKKGSVIWNSQFISFLPYTLINAVSKRDTMAASEVANAEAVSARMAKAPSETVSSYFLTSEEREEYGQLEEALLNIEKRWRQLFIDGQKTLGKDWSEFTAELDAAGLARYTELAQKAYDSAK